MKHINSSIHVPFSVPLTQILCEIEEGNILLGQEFDCGLPCSRDELSPRAVKGLDDVLKLLQPILDNYEIISDPFKRSNAFNEIADANDVTARRIRRLFYQYLWGGMNELALAPRYSDRGAPGKQQQAGTKRRGRVAENGSSVSLPEVRNKLEKGVKLFFLPGKRTFPEAFVDTLKKYFSNGVKITKNANGKSPTLEELLVPENKRPTERQFRHVCDYMEVIHGKRLNIPRRIRQKKPEWNFVGRSRDGVLGPGYRFEIDATKIQVKLVSRLGRSKIVGNLTVYLAIDVWSEVIVGYAISLKGESWDLARKALMNCCTDKVKIFERFQLDYESDDWSCRHLPSRIAADRAAMLSDKAGVVPGTGIKIEIMAAMCPERKGSIESAIKNIKHRRSRRLAGEYPKDRKRRESDGTKTAALNLDEYEEVLVETIMALNHEPAPARIIPPEMIEDGETDVSYMGLYNWGIKHLVGFTRKIPEKDVITHLMTEDKALLTVRGIYYKKQTYVSVELCNAGHITIENDKKYIDIRTDELDGYVIRFWNKKTKQWDPAYNDNPDIKRRRASYAEIEKYEQELNILRKKVKYQNVHRSTESDKRLSAKEKIAQEETRLAKKDNPTPNSKRNVRVNKKLEIEYNDMLNSGIPTPPLVKNEDSEQSVLSPPQQNTNSQAGDPVDEKPKAISISQQAKERWRLNK